MDHLLAGDEHAATRDRHAPNLDVSPTSFEGGQHDLTIDDEEFILANE